MYIECYGNTMLRTIEEAPNVSESLCCRPEVHSSSLTRNECIGPGSSRKDPCSELSARPRTATFDTSSRGKYTSLGTFATSAAFKCPTRFPGAISRESLRLLRAGTSLLSLVQNYHLNKASTPSTWANLPRKFLHRVHSMFSQRRPSTWLIGM